MDVVGRSNGEASIPQSKSSSKYRWSFVAIGVVGCIAFVSLIGEIRFTSNLLKVPVAEIIQREISACSCDHEEQSRMPLKYTYLPADVENFVLNHTAELGYTRLDDPRGCNIWKDPTSTPYYEVLQAFLQNLTTFAHAQATFAGIDQDIRELLKGGTAEQICRQLELQPGNLTSFFPHGMLSWTSRAGYLEPLLPPMRHPGICFDRFSLMKMDYLIHDFPALCRSIRPTSRTVLIDMGASLDFHAGETSPAMYLIELYNKFGFRFDHIYAFEITPKQPSQVYEKVPDYLVPAYHWINVAVSPDLKAKTNPLTTILKGFNSDDLVVVKLDIDTPSVEMPLARQILSDPRLSEIIDHLYFEHHVHLWELARAWRTSMEGTIESSLELFRAMRAKGVAAHFWP